MPRTVREGPRNQPIVTKMRLEWAIQVYSGRSKGFQCLNIYYFDCERNYNALHKILKDSFYLKGLTKKLLHYTTLHVKKSRQITSARKNEVALNRTSGKPLRQVHKLTRFKERALATFEAIAVNELLIVYWYGCFSGGRTLLKFLYHLL